MSKTTEVVVQETTAVATTSGIRRGFEHVDKSSMTLPTAKLLQPTSPEVTDESFTDYGFKAGNVVHSLLLDKMPETFIPLIIYDGKTCFVPKNDAVKIALKAKVKEKFNVVLTDDDLKGLFICRSKDNKTGDRFGSCEACGLCKFDGNEKPFCNNNIEVLSIFEGQELPVIVRFTSTSHKHGRTFKNLTYYAPGDLFSRRYKIAPIKKTDNGNTWYELTVKPAGKVEGDTFAFAEMLYNQFIGMDVEAQADTVEVDAVVVEREF